jgi:hypothetical protein
MKRHRRYNRPAGVFVPSVGAMHCSTRHKQMRTTALQCSTVVLNCSCILQRRSNSSHTRRHYTSAPRSVPEPITEPRNTLNTRKEDTRRSGSFSMCSVAHQRIALNKWFALREPRRVLQDHSLIRFYEVLGGELDCDE